MGFDKTDEVQGYFRRGWFPVTDDNFWTVNLTPLQLKVNFRLLKHWRATGSRYLSPETYDRWMFEAGYQQIGGAKKSLASKAIAVPFELVEGHPIIWITGVPYREPGDDPTVSTTPWPCEANALTREVTMWCMPSDLKPLVLESDVALFYSMLVDRVMRTGDAVVETDKLTSEILLALYCSDARAAQKLYTQLSGIGLFRFIDSKTTLIQVRPYKVGEDGEIVIPPMCQKAPAPVVENEDSVLIDEAQIHEVDSDMANPDSDEVKVVHGEVIAMDEMEISPDPPFVPGAEAVCTIPEIDLDAGEDLPMAFPSDLMEYEITELIGILEAIESAAKQEAFAIVTFSPFSTIEQIVVGNEVGLDDILDRAQLLWKVRKASRILSGMLGEVRGARDHLVRKIAAYNRFDNEE
jgi:hypothetical protein